MSSGTVGTPLYVLGAGSPSPSYTCKNRPDTFRSPKINIRKINIKAWHDNYAPVQRPSTPSRRVPLVLHVRTFVIWPLRPDFRARAFDAHLEYPRVLHLRARRRVPCGVPSPWIGSAVGDERHRPDLLVCVRDDGSGTLEDCRAVVEAVREGIQGEDEFIDVHRCDRYGESV